MQRKEVKPVNYYCAYCGEKNQTFVDPSQGKEQEYIEDCQVCCQPNKLVVQYDQWSQEYVIQAKSAQ